MTQILKSKRNSAQGEVGRALLAEHGGQQRPGGRSLRTRVASGGRRGSGKQRGTGATCTVYRQRLDWGQRWAASVGLSVPRGGESLWEGAPGSSRLLVQARGSRMDERCQEKLTALCRHRVYIQHSCVISFQSRQSFAECLLHAPLMLLPFLPNLLFRVFVENKASPFPPTHPQAPT